MASIELTTSVHSQHGQGYAWSTATNYNGSNGDNNNFYVGGSNDRYRARLYFTVPSSTAIAQSEKLVVKLAGYGQNGGSIATSRTRAYLSTTNLSTSDYSGWANLASPIKSYLYSDANGTNRITGSRTTTSGYNVYLVFNTTTLKAGTTYYIYLLPYSDDSAGISSPNFNNSWMQWKNNPSGSTSSLSVFLYYKETVKITYNVNGGSGTIAKTSLTQGIAGKVTSTKPTPPTATQANAYTITYNASGGVCNTTTATNTKTTTYTFSKWNTKSDGTGTNYSSGADITISANTTLYAKYTSSSTYSELTAPNASKSDSTETARLTYIANNGNIGTLNFNECSRTVTYPFLGWYTTDNVLRAQGGATFTPTKTEALTAKFGEQKADFESIVLPSPPNNAGLTFVGWKIDGIIYATGDIVQITGNTNAIAQWEPVICSVCIYNSYTNETIYSTEVTYGSVFSVPNYDREQYRYESICTDKFIILQFHDDATNYDSVDYPSMRQTVQLSDRLLVETKTTDGEYLPEIIGIQGIQQTVPIGETISIIKDTRLVMSFAPVDDDVCYVIITVPMLKRLGYKIAYWSSSAESSAQFIFGVPTRVDISIARSGQLWPMSPTWIRSTETDKDNLYFKMNGEYKIAQPYVKVNGQYVRGIASYVKVNGVWRCV